MTEYDELKEAVKDLLRFIQEKYPNDWKDGVYQFKCPYHIKLNELVNGK